MTLLWSSSSPAGAAGIPLVFLHGFPLDSRMWHPLLECLTDVPTIVIDLPGMGRSPSGQQIERHYAADRPDIALAARAVADTLAELGHRRAIFAGLSMGGYVAMGLLREHRDVVAGLAMLDTKAEADTPQARQGRLEVADQVLQVGSSEPVWPMATSLLGATTREARPELIELQRSWISQAQAEGIAWSQRAMAARPDSTELLATWDGPAEVIVGAEDEIAPVANAQAMVEAMPRARLTIIRAAGHMSALENPGPVAEPLRRLYREVAQG